MGISPQVRMVGTIAAVGVAIGASQFANYMANSPEAAEELANELADGVDPSVSPEEAADQRLNAKLGRYIQHCTNRFNQPINRARDRYASWLEDPVAGPTGSERNVYGIFQVSGDVSQCSEAISAAAEMEPNDTELELAAASFNIALTTVVPLINEAHRYYQRNNYRDDEFAGAKRMHGPLWAALDAYRQASLAFDAAIDPRNRALSERRLTRLEADGSHALQAKVERVMLLSQDIVEMTHGWSVDGDKLQGIDAAALSAAVGRLEPLVDQASQMIASGANDAEVGSTSSTWVRSFSREADGFLRAAKELMRRVRDGEALSSSDMRSLSGPSAWMVDGAPPKLIRAYNEMIDEYNRIRWVR